MGKGAQVGDGEAVTASDLRGFLDALAGLAADVDDAERVEQLAALEALQAARVAAQARVMVGLSDSQVGVQAEAGLAVRQRGRGVPEQVGLACRISPQAAAVRLGRARAWLTQLPFTLRALERGRISERVADAAVRQTSHLGPADRRAVDALAAPLLPDLSFKEADAAIRRLAYERDPAGLVERIGRAAQDRAVWSRPAPDCMSVLSAVLPVADGVAAYAALDQHARELRAAGDARSLPSCAPTPWSSG